MITNGGDDLQDGDPNRNERWFAINTQSGKEAIAEINLKKQGFVPFLPMIRKTISHARKRQTVRRAFFPGYLFLPMDVERDRWRSVNGTIGVIRLVMRGDKPLPVPYGIVENLHALSDEAGIVDTRPHIQAGDTVRVTTGAFSDHIGVVARLSDNNRIEVLMSFLGGERKVTLTADTIVPAA